MEPAHQLISEEWGSLSGFYTAEEADFMTQLLAPGNNNYSVTENKHCLVNSTDNCPSSAADTNFLCFSQGSTSSSTTTGSGGTYSYYDLPYLLGDAKFSPQSCFLQWSDNLISQQINKSSDEESGPYPCKQVLGDTNLKAKTRELEMMVFEPAEEDTSRKLEKPPKRVRSSTEASKIMRNAKSRKSAKSASMMSNNEEDRSAGLQRQESSGSFSDGDSNASPLELNGGESSNLSLKNDPSPPKLCRRANTSPATDPQSLYARKRRERINERLRILQNLVPNGTKVDISTMLEEAVQYVKFLQLQIKLLSSEDLWMYAPIAYNGINIGLDFSKIPTNGR